ncbi:uncharacterized protein KQ657_000475 [Scheffersomyces spartinae]|uniref:Uncharacterized protein n=1 Tax=Scheffersomyces spartinae TaxID=45513 RepID=A0A9P8AHW0_9ASCO|nr:uncharacterized protein KQ657_000475 [Scheffersomyces spartinae]KAG7193782.1 hypothetical protein KQ657_000475 [Scheffersomyces spartinae]
MLDVVIVKLEELDDFDDLSRLKQAFGPDSLGIIIVKHQDPHIASLRNIVLLNASKLANLPPTKLSQLECPEAFWLVGWSRGRERLKNGEYDFNKGSFYANCAFHVNPQYECPPPEMCLGDYSQFKAYTTRNIWPSDNTIKLFEKDFKELCNYILNVAGKVARICDQYMTQIVEDFQPGFLERIVKESTTTKARMLHYYPIAGTSGIQDDWCGEHLDHSCLTGLLPASYVDGGGEIVSDTSPDNEGGLYIRNRKGELVKVDIPSDCIAFQTGSALEEITRGRFKAVPHYVKGVLVEGIARNTLAVFCQPNLHELVNDTQDFAQYAQMILEKHH